MSQPTKSKPRSWKEALAHPNVQAIDPEEHDGLTKFYVSIANHVYNPVTDWMGGAFFVESFRELRDQLNWNITDQSNTNERTKYCASLPECER
tara:strand:+ start:95 stop:373 length:279 start_codon:yes stop_codon:yes gene_type:complete